MMTMIATTTMTTRIMITMMQILQQILHFLHLSVNIKDENSPCTTSKSTIISNKLTIYKYI